MQSTMQIFIPLWSLYILQEIGGAQITTSIVRRKRNPSRYFIAAPKGRHQNISTR